MYLHMHVQLHQHWVKMLGIYSAGKNFLHLPDFNYFLIFSVQIMYNIFIFKLYSVDFDVR